MRPTLKSAKKLTHRQLVLRRYPKAVMISSGYIQVPDGRGWATVIGRSWKDAASLLNPPSKRA